MTVYVPDAGAPHPQSRVLVVAPTRRDGVVTHDLLTKAGIECVVCTGARQAAAHLIEGVGAVVLTDTVFTDPDVGEFVDTLLTQPPWSDIPILLLTRERVALPAGNGALASLGNVTLLDRPTSTRSMVSAVRAALRARARQFEIRDQLSALRNADLALRDADVRKDEFLATLAHELRNPLAAIRAGLAVAERSPADQPRIARMLSMIDRQSGMLAKLIDDLMDVSRIATGKVVIQRHVIDFRSVLELGLEAGQTVVDAARHEIRVEQPAAPVWIRGDSSRLAQVVGNLINNAAKYTPDGGQIEVQLTQEPAEARLRIIDTGVGIPPDQLSNVFEMFTQVDHALDRARGGLGIGLSLVRRLVELHGGTVSAQSEGVGKGSVFIVRLPLAGESANDESESGKSIISSATRPLKILVVDDNRDLAYGMGALLTGYGHDVRYAYDGKTAVLEARGFEPDIVFCDIGLPGMSGHEVAKAIRADIEQKTPFLVAVTGWGNQEDRRMSLEAGFDLHHTKPMSVEQISQVLAHR